MYVPSAFRIEDAEKIRGFVRAHSFGILVTATPLGLVVTHLPMILVIQEEKEILIGHVAKANDHWQAFGAPSLAIFPGPHGYVSPASYVSRPNVPTWNYLAVHAHGTPEIVTDRAEGVRFLQDMVEVFDPHLGDTHPEATEESYVDSKLNGLVLFRMTVENWEAKAKLNQNRPEADRLAIREKYLLSDLGDELEMAKWMPPANS
jgi:transcriptional regulator